MTATGASSQARAIGSTGLLLSLWVAAVVLASATAWGQPVASLSNVATIRIGGIVSHPLVLSENDLSAFKRTSVTVLDDQGAKTVYEGVPIVELLTRAGAPLGPQLRGPQMKLYVAVKGADGYEAVFALPEFDPAFSDRVIMLADRRDGKPMSAREGAFRVVVPGGKAPRPLGAASDCARSRRSQIIFLPAQVPRRPLSALSGNATARQAPTVFAIMIVVCQESWRGRSTRATGHKQQSGNAGETNGSSSTVS